MHFRRISVPHSELTQRDDIRGNGTDTQSSLASAADVFEQGGERLALRSLRPANEPLDAGRDDSLTP